MASGLVTTLAGGNNGYYQADGVGTMASFYNPQGVAMDAAGAVALVVRRRFGRLSCGQQDGKRES